jgi:hypothetical protein
MVLTMIRWINGHIINNGCPGHIGDRRGLPWLPHPGDTKKTVVHPAESKSIRRNSDVSPIAVLVDHENLFTLDYYAGS